MRLLLPLVLAGSALAQGNGAPVAITSTDTSTATTSVGGSQISAKSELKLAKKYTTAEFLNEWGELILPPVPKISTHVQTFSPPMILQEDM